MNQLYQRMKFDRNPINTECNVTHLIIFMLENIQGHITFKVLTVYVFASKRPALYHL